MNAFVQSLRRLYVAGSVKDEKLAELKASGKLNDVEIHYIKTGEL